MFRYENVERYKDIRDATRHVHLVILNFKLSLFNVLIARMHATNVPRVRKNSPSSEVINALFTQKSQCHPKSSVRGYVCAA